MKFKLVEIPELSGNKATIYTVIDCSDNKTLFDRFLEENNNSHLSEIKDIITRLKVIGERTGAREHFFKLNEGSPGDGVCALYDLPNKKLRLYCIRYGTQIIILGGGGPKKVQKLQQDAKLTKESYFLRELSIKITERLRDKDIKYNYDGDKFEGDFEFEI